MSPADKVFAAGLLTVNLRVSADQIRKGRLTLVLSLLRVLTSHKLRMCPWRHILLKKTTCKLLMSFGLVAWWRLSNFCTTLKTFLKLEESGYPNWFYKYLTASLKCCTFLDSMRLLKTVLQKTNPLAAWWHSVLQPTKMHKAVQNHRNQWMLPFKNRTLLHGDIFHDIMILAHFWMILDNFGWSSMI